MFKRIKDISLAILTVFIIISICVIVWINYFWWLTWKVVKGDSFCANKEYSVWKILGGDNITFFCDNKNKNRCISWIKSYILWEKGDLYLAFELPVFAWKSESELSDMLNVDNPKWYIYNVFQNDYNNKYYAKTYNDILRYLKLDYSDCKITFYNNSDIDKLSDIEKNMFSKINYK